MVDREARQCAITILARIKEQGITNWQLEDEWPSSEDPALNCILRWLWTLYSDFPEFPLIDVLSKQDIQIIEKCSLFLSSDLEFQVSEPPSFWEKMKIIIKWGREWRTNCTLPTDDDNWPFPKSQE